MRSVVRQAHHNDNINTIYVVDQDGKYAGAFELKDLIIARDYVPLDDIVSKSYPSVRAKAKISDVIEDLKDYIDSLKQDDAVAEEVFVDVDVPAEEAEAPAEKAPEAPAEEPKAEEAPAEAPEASVEIQVDTTDNAE